MENGLKYIKHQSCRFFDTEILENQSFKRHIGISINLLGIMILCYFSINGCHIFRNLGRRRKPCQNIFGCDKEIIIF